MISAECLPDITEPYILLDDIQEVAVERDQVREEAAAVLEARRQGWDVGGVATAELLPVDALSTAHRVIDAQEEFGFRSPERVERWRGLVRDCERLIAEARRKLTYEYFPSSRHVLNEAEDDYASDGMSIGRMTENALVPIPGNSEEEQRRVNEKVEDATPLIVRRNLGALALGKKIRTISECTDWAIDAHAAGEAQGGGYVPEIKKFMIRDITLDEETGDRFQEQIGLSGEYITHYIFQEALRRRGVNVANMDKTQLHGAQILVDDDLFAFVALLDRIASEEWCSELYMGEQLEEGQQRNYANVPAEAARRQAESIGLAETTAMFVYDLALDGVSSFRALGKVEEFVKMILIGEGKKDIQAARYMFGDETAAGLEEVVRLERAGRYEEAFELEEQVKETAPAVGFCGAGSCGLEAVNVRSDDGKDLVERLRAMPGDKIVRDKERTCRCGNKTIVYAYNRNKVNKLCETCGAFESTFNVTPRGK